MTSFDTKHKKKFDKSYALVEFEDFESKMRALRTETRVFGFYLLGNLCPIEDADYKRSLVLYNIPYGTSCQEIGLFLDEHLSRLEGKENNWVFFNC